MASWSLGKAHIWSCTPLSGLRRRFETCKPLFGELKILTLAGLVGYELCSFVKGNPKLFVSNGYYHQYPTRSRGLISVAAHSTSAFERGPYHLELSNSYQLQGPVSALSLVISPHPSLGLAIDLKQHEIEQASEMLAEFKISI
ncbi:hypothetical protein J6590_097498 [Homalodisca vitripennis]|nr:hypothetical protein J6590_030321 [Homalodisca vitripennis]KAG8308951.1 hypothetical protein J6590_097498 [Homalodisca vitripennis]